MSASDFIALKADIRLRGIVEPIWTKNKKIIDGRHRWRAYQELKAEGFEIECPTREFAGDDILSFVIAANVMRRHLSGQQKRAIIKKLLKVHPERSNRSLAKTTGVDHKTVAKARTDAEANGEIPHSAERIESTGRKARGIKRKPATRPIPTLSDREYRESRQVFINSVIARCIPTIKRAKSRLLGTEEIEQLRHAVCAVLDQQTRPRPVLMASTLTGAAP